MPLTEVDCQNFDMLKRAFQNDDVALLECQSSNSGTPVAVICAVNRSPDESFEFVPFAQLVSGDPYQLFVPPVPENEEPSQHQQGSEISPSEP